jgi:DHA1 family bicyclomycin/chloramphenicol resistance-like MFS transporter
MHTERRRAQLRRLALVIGAMGMIGPFCIDTLFPAFRAVEADFSVAPWQMQQTLSIYLACFALMSLVHGPLSDRFGRRPVLLVSLAVFVLASLGAMLAGSLDQLLWWRALQGLSAGAGTIVGRAIVRDSASGPDAQRLMSQITLVFAIAPAVAPIIGGAIHAVFGWRAIFLFMTAFGVAVWLACRYALGETHPVHARTQLNWLGMLRGYVRMLGHPAAVLLIGAAACNFAALFLYISSAPAVVEGLLGLNSTQYHWFFLPMIGAILLGSQLSGWMAGRVPPRRVVALAYVVMTCVCVVNVLLSQLSGPSSFLQTIVPAAAYGIGSALAFPTLTLKLLDLYPHERGAAASMQAFVGLSLNALVAGALSPWLAHNAAQLALGQAGLMLLGLLLWLLYLWAVPSRQHDPTLG